MSRFVVFGGRTGLDSFRHINRAYHETARKIGLDTIWVDDQPGVALEAGDLVFCPDIYNKHLPFHPKADYILHNFFPDHPVLQNVDPDHLLRLQVWTTDAFGDEWDTCRQFSKDHRILFQPWGSDLLAEEFMEPQLNVQSRDVVFIGAIWSDVLNGVELGNEGVIEALKNAAGSRGLQFVHKTQIPNVQMVELTRNARLAPTVVGLWQQQHGYLPCRAFKHASYGVPVFTNSTYIAELFQTVAAPTIQSLVEGAIRLRQKDYLELAAEHQKVAARYTYRESILSIQRAFEELRGSGCAPFSSGATKS